MIKVKSFKKLKSGKKKYEITFEKNGKTYVRKFGAAGMSDFTIHKDRERRERYISRHKKDLRTGDPMKPGFLSMYILWNKPSLKASLADYKRRLNVYNRTGKFPTGISGSKKLSFGATDPCSSEALRNLPEDIQQVIKQQCAASIIQGVGKKMDPKRSLFETLKIKGLQRYQNSAKRTKNPRENMHFINKLWTNLDPVNDFTAKWLTRASKVLVKNDFDFKTRNFWWKVIENQIQAMTEIEEDGDPSEGLPPNEYIYYEKCQNAIMIILNKVGYPITIDDIDEGWADEALRFWRSKKTNTFGKKKTPFGTIIPFEETSLRKLPTDLQNLIQRDVSSSDIQRIQRGRNVRKIPANMMTKRFLKQLLWRMNAEHESPEYATEQMTSDYGEPWLILNPGRTGTAQWLYYAADILTAKDFDDDDLWYLCLEHVVDEFVDLDPDINVYQGQVAANITASQDNVEVLLGKIGHYIDYDEPRWYNRALAWLKEEYATGNAFGKKGGSKIPNNVINKKLYASIKAKIKRSIKGRRWGAYDSGRLVREYKAAGGGYTGKKGKTDLGRWYKEKWVDACAWPKRKPCGRKTKEKIAYCRPSKRIDSKTPKLVQQLTKAQIKSRCAKKKKSPMKRVTKFGQTTPDEEIGNGWVIHCNFIPGIGPHATLRRKDIAGPTRDTDHAFRYGIKYAGQPPEFWSSGPLAKGLPSQQFQNLLMNYYYKKCGGWHLAKLPPASPAPGYLQFGATQEIVDKMRQQMYNQIMASSDVSRGIENTISKRCKRGFQDSFCQTIFTDLLLSIYFTIVKNSVLTDNRKQNISEMEKFIPNNFKPTLLKINKSQFSKIDEMLYSLQDHTYGTFKNARVASLIYEYIHVK